MKRLILSLSLCASPVLGVGNPLFTEHSDVVEGETTYHAGRAFVCKKYTNRDRQPKLCTFTGTGKFFNVVTKHMKRVRDKSTHRVGPFQEVKVCFDFKEHLKDFSDDGAVELGLWVSAGFEAEVVCKDISSVSDSAMTAESMDF